MEFRLARGHTHFALILTWCAAQLSYDSLEVPPTVASIASGGLAEQVGVEAGDVVLYVNDVDMRDTDQAPHPRAMARSF